MNIFEFIAQALVCVFSGMLVGLEGFIASIPIYEAFENFKDQVIASSLGVPVIIVSAVGTITTITKLIFKLFLKPSL